MTPGQEQLRVAAPSRQIARRQPLDLSGTFQTIATGLGSVLEQKRAREKTQLDAALSQATQQAIMNTGQQYYDTRESLQASGDLTPELGNKLKFKARQSLRQDLITAGITDKDMVSHAISQLEKDFVKGDWSTKDISITQKEVVDPFGNKTYQSKTTEEIGAAMLIDLSKTDPPLAKKYGHLLTDKNATVTDKSGKVVMDHSEALQMLSDRQDALYRAEKAKAQALEAIDLETKRAGLESAKFGALKATRDFLKPTTNQLASLTLQQSAYSLAQEYDWDHGSKEDFKMRIVQLGKKQGASEYLTTMDTVDEGGNSLNKALYADWMTAVDSMADKMADDFHNAYVQNPELVQNIKARGATLKAIQDYGTMSASGTPYFEATRKTAIAQYKTEGPQLLLTSMKGLGDLSQRVEQVITMGEAITTPEQRELWLTYNMNNASNLEIAETALRAFKPGDPKFADAFNTITSLNEVYLNNLSKDVRGDMHKIYYQSIELMLANPKVREYLYTSYDKTQADSIIDNLKKTSTFAKQELLQLDKDMGFKYSQRVLDFVEDAKQKSMLITEEIGKADE